MLNFENLTYTISDKSILSACSGSIARGSFTAVLGPNGAGKTTLLRRLAGILPGSGIVTMNGHVLDQGASKQRAQLMSYVPQQTDRPGMLRVRDVVALGRAPYQQRWAWESSTDRCIIEQALGAMQITELAQQPISHISGGEWQRVNIARALAQQPSLLILDEPTTHLDIKHQHDLLDLLCQRQAHDNITILAAIHDMNLALQYCDHGIFLRDGELLAHGPIEEVAHADSISALFDTPVSLSMGFHALRD